MSDNITHCNGCKCMTHSIRKSRAKFICGKCNHDKTLGDLYQYELKEGMKNEKLPKFIRLGKNGTAMRLKQDRYTNKNTYYRDAGGWNTDFRIDKVTGKLYANFKSMPHIHNLELIPTTYEDWKKDNGKYAN